jgi:hypothetical protein
MLSKEDAMLAPDLAPAKAATPTLAPPASIQAAAERGLRSSRYSALKHVSCDYRDGVLVLRGRLPTYYLKQIAQEVVAHQFDQAERLENRIQVVRPARR